MLRGQPSTTWALILGCDRGGRIAQVEGTEPNRRDDYMSDLIGGYGCRQSSHPSAGSIHITSDQGYAAGAQHREISLDHLKWLMIEKPSRDPAIPWAKIYLYRRLRQYYSI